MAMSKAARRSRSLLGEVEAGAMSFGAVDGQIT
jgi:hypothetical protein